MRKDSAWRRTRRRRTALQTPSPRSFGARRLKGRADAAFDSRLGSDSELRAIVSMDFMPAEAIPALESLRWSPRRADEGGPIAYELARSVEVEGTDIGQVRQMFVERLREGLNLLDAAHVDESAFADPEAWFRTFVTLSTGSWEVPNDMLTRLAAAWSNIWVDAT